MFNFFSTLTFHYVRFVILFFELLYFLIWFEYFIFYFIFRNDFDLTNKKIFNNYKEDRTNRLEKENNIYEMSI